MNPVEKWNDYVRQNIFFTPESDESDRAATLHYLYREFDAVSKSKSILADMATIVCDSSGIVAIERELAGESCRGYMTIDSLPIAPAAKEELRKLESAIIRKKYPDYALICELMESATF